MMVRWSALILGILLIGSAAGEGGAQILPPVPAANPITEEKRTLGKILFWDQQLSTDHTVACGTCHAPSAGGADPAPAVHPGPDGLFETADDTFGSAGVVRRDASGSPVSDPLFGLAPQVTRRAAPSFFGDLAAPESFWDGRAPGAFFDPLTGVLLIPEGGALEAQSLAPLLSPVEMAKEGRTWSDLTHRLETVSPLAFASEIPSDMAAALLSNPSYPALFASAFGDSQITPARIAFALATYERTLVADQTPWDLFVAGDASALNRLEAAGWAFFQTSDCSGCHPPPLFTDHSFRNIGVRDPLDDAGRREVTGLQSDRGRFKVPTLRNAGLKADFFHSGDAANLDEVLDLYQPGEAFPDNLDTLLPIVVPGSNRATLIAFLTTGLTDPRVAAESFPFDRPVLAPEPSSIGLLVAGGLYLAAAARRRHRKRRNRPLCTSTDHVDPHLHPAGRVRRDAARPREALRPGRTGSCARRLRFDANTDPPAILLDPISGALRPFR